VREHEEMFSSCFDSFSANKAPTEPDSSGFNDHTSGGDDGPTYTFALDPGLVDAPPKPPILGPDAEKTNSSLSMLLIDKCDQCADQRALA
jgi:hypothetical protein